MPNLWILNHYAVGPRSSGGTRHYDLARELTAHNWDVTIFASSFEHQSRKDPHLQPKERRREECINGVRFVWVKTPPYYQNDLRRAWNMVVYAARTIRYGSRQQRPDVVIGSSVHPLAACAGCALAKRNQCPFVFEVRDLWPQTIVDMGRYQDSHPIVQSLRRVERFLYRQARKIIVLLPKAADYITNRYGVDQEKILWLPNGVDLTRYSSQKLPLDDRLEGLFAGLSGKRIIAYTGAHGQANSLDAIVGAAEILQHQGERKLHFLLVGDGPEKPRLQRLAGEKNLLNLTFLDPVPKEFVPAILERVDAGLLPLEDSPVFRWGISPNKLFDYMAAALPVFLLCKLAPANPVELSGGGMVLPSGDPQTLANVLLEVTIHPESLRRMGQKARTYVEKEHAISILGRRLNRLLTELLPRPQVAARPSTASPASF